MAVLYFSEFYFHAKNRGLDEVLLVSKPKFCFVLHTYYDLMFADRTKSKIYHVVSGANSTRL
jgi:hypothetical protein